MADYSTPLGRVRLLITDTSDVPADQIFSDEQLTAFLDMSGENVYRAAAEALLVMAANEALISKKIRTQDLATDGPAVSAELRALAERLTLKAAEADAAAGTFFELVPFAEPAALEGVEWRFP